MVRTEMHPMTPLGRIFPGLLLSLLLITVLPGAGWSASLWLGGQDLYTPHGAARDYKPGDIITVKIAEESSAQQAATTNTQDDVQVEVKSGPQIPFFKKIVNQFMGKNEIKNNWKGNGTTTRTGKLAGTVSASVLEVLPNGNLLLEGSRAIRVNRETQHLKVRGVARPRDIDTTNSIDSKNLADAEIRYEGKGSVGQTQKPGLMTQINNWLF